MNTPIYDFVTEYAKKDCTRLHMPGHKGHGALCENLDITEIKGADSLFEASGIIAKSEENAASLFNTKKTLYSTQGSTLAIQAMLTLVSSDKKSQNKPLIIAVRNAHKAFINTCALLDIDVKWVHPEYTQNSITSGEFSALDIETAIAESDRKPCAVYITSPDYLGRIADIKSISKVCKKYSIPLLVDNAHGAYLNFLEENLHPISLGADMCSDSAHKTLPVLTGGAYLHISKNADSYFSENAKSAMSMFGSTSPSYLTLSSLDLCNKYLSENIKKDLAKIIPEIIEVKKALTRKGYICCFDEPFKITLFTVNTGYYGYEIADILRKEKIECEYSDKTHIVFMITGYNTTDELTKLEENLLKIEFRNKTLDLPFLSFEKLSSAMSIRDAALSRSEDVLVEDSVGRICAKTVVACPPGIPVAVSGEIITKNTVNIFKSYSISYINVIK